MLDGIQQVLRVTNQKGEPMSKIYDVFADEYIDKEDVDVNAPPERYKDVDDDLLISNAARWIVEGIRRTNEPD